MQVRVRTGVCFTPVTNDHDRRRFLISQIGYNVSAGPLILHKVV